MYTDALVGGLKQKDHSCRNEGGWN